MEFVYVLVGNINWIQYLFFFGGVREIISMVWWVWEDWGVSVIMVYYEKI